jgi:hypothetical protein
VYFSGLAWNGFRTARCRSSVVEHPLGKGEVVSSILTGSTSQPKNHCPSGAEADQIEAGRAEAMLAARAAPGRLDLTRKA